MTDTQVRVLTRLVPNGTTATVRVGAPVNRTYTSLVQSNVANVTIPSAHMSDVASANLTAEIILAGETLTETVPIIKTDGKPVFGAITLNGNQLTVNWQANNPIRKFAAHLSSTPQPNNDETIGNDLGQSIGIGSVEQHVFTISQTGEYTAYLRLRYSDNDWTDGDTTVADGRYIDTTVAINISEGNERTGVSITNAGATASGGTLRIHFTDSGAIDGVTLYDIWEGNNDLTTAITAPATYIDVPLPADGQVHTLTLRPPAGYDADPFQHVSAQFTAADGVIYPIDFGNSADSSISNSNLSNWIDGFASSTNPEFLSVVDHGGSDFVLRHRYVPTHSGPNGSEPVVIRWDIPTYRSYRLKESFYFEPGFKWGRDERDGNDFQSAKIGFGFAGGSRPSGGQTQTDGFTSRINFYGNHLGNSTPIGQPEFDGNAKFATYAYSADRPSSSGQIDIFGNNIPIGEWVDIVHEVIMNSSPSASDGENRVWVNGVMQFQRTGIQWWGSGGTPQIDTLYYSSFFGGNLYYAPPYTVYARLRDVAIAPVIDGACAINP